MRAKTGTLTGVPAPWPASPPTRDGHALVFAFVSDRVEYAETLDARAALDATAAALAGCRLRLADRRVLTHAHVRSLHVDRLRVGPA